MEVTMFICKAVKLLLLPSEPWDHLRTSSWKMKQHGEGVPVKPSQWPGWGHSEPDSSWLSYPADLLSSQMSGPHQWRLQTSWTQPCKIKTKYIVIVLSHQVWGYWLYSNRWLSPKMWLVLGQGGEGDTISGGLLSVTKTGGLRSGPTTSDLATWTSSEPPSETVTDVTESTSAFTPRTSQHPPAVRWMWSHARGDAYSRYGGDRGDHSKNQGQRHLDSGERNYSSPTSLSGKV